MQVEPEILSDIESKIDGLLKRLQDSENVTEIEKIRIEALGKKGYIPAQMRAMAQLQTSQKKILGLQLNQARQKISQAIEERQKQLYEINLNRQLASQKEDMTLPSHHYDPLSAGRIHPLSQVNEEILEIFLAMGFSVAEGPDIETDYYNFTSLNFPPHHPARQMHDTFFFNRYSADKGQYLLRTHTSPVQIHTMQKSPPPHRVIVPGRTYRKDSDQTHTPMFHQLEGLVVGTDIHLGHLKWVLQSFCQIFFELDDAPMRYRPSYFPFTEPSLEVDIRCSRKQQKLQIGKGEEWLEVLGCGMVHQNVLRNVGIDPELYQGFAFGMGIDRLAMLKYAIPDLRSFFDGDIEWLKHYGFDSFDIPANYRKVAL